jgi:hypothetical protein
MALACVLRREAYCWLMLCVTARHTGMGESVESKEVTDTQVLRTFDSCKQIVGCRSLPRTHQAAAGALPGVTCR